MCAGCVVLRCVCVCVRCVARARACVCVYVRAWCGSGGGDGSGGGVCLWEGKCWWHGAGVDGYIVARARVCVGREGDTGMELA